MANEQAPAAEAPKKKRRSQGPRTQRPLYAVVTYTDEQGQPVKLDGSRLQIKVERDTAKLLEAAFAGGGSTEHSTLMRIELPAPTPRAKQGEASQG